MEMGRAVMASEEPPSILLTFHGEFPSEFHHSFIAQLRDTPAVFSQSLKELAGFLYILL